MDLGNRLKQATAHLWNKHWVEEHAAIRLLQGRQANLGVH